MSRTALVLSPHLDDAVFSCGGTLALLARTGWRVVLATLFTRSMPDPQGFALACQLDKGLAPEVDYMALRRGEDVAAASALGLSDPVHVPLPEAPHRGYGSAQVLFGAVLPMDTIAEPLATAVHGLIDRHRPDLILAPQAIGGHVDHVQVVRSLASVTRPICWWRDYPYAVREGSPAEPFASHMATIPAATVVLDTAAREAKEAACLAYASQIGFQFGGADKLRQQLDKAGPTEIFCGEIPGDLVT